MYARVFVHTRTQGLHAKLRRAVCVYGDCAPKTNNMQTCDARLGSYTAVFPLPPRVCHCFGEPFELGGTAAKSRIAHRGTPQPSQRSEMLGGKFFRVLTVVHARARSVALKNGINHDVVLAV